MCVQFFVCRVVLLPSLGRLASTLTVHHCTSSHCSCCASPPRTSWCCHWRLSLPLFLLNKRNCQRESLEEARREAQENEEQERGEDWVPPPKFQVGLPRIQRCVGAGEVRGGWHLEHGIGAISRTFRSLFVFTLILEVRRNCLCCCSTYVVPFLIWCVSHP